MKYIAVWYRYSVHTRSNFWQTIWELRGHVSFTWTNRHTGNTSFSENEHGTFTGIDWHRGPNLLHRFYNIPSNWKHVCTNNDNWCRCGAVQMSSWLCAVSVCSNVSHWYAADKNQTEWTWVFGEIGMFWLICVQAVQRARFSMLFYFSDSFVKRQSLPLCRKPNNLLLGLFWLFLCWCAPTWMNEKQEERAVLKKVWCILFLNNYIKLELDKTLLFWFVVIQNMSDDVVSSDKNSPIQDV